MTFIFIFSPLLLRSNTADAAVCVFITVEWQHKTVHSASSCSSILICIPIIFLSIGTTADQMLPKHLRDMS